MAQGVSEQLMKVRRSWDRKRPGEKREQDKQEDVWENCIEAFSYILRMYCADRLDIFKGLWMELSLPHENPPLAGLPVCLGHTLQGTGAFSPLFSGLYLLLLMGEWG